MNPIETTQSLIQEGPVLGERSVRLLESSNLQDIEGSWEKPNIEAYLSEMAARELNAKNALRHINGSASGGRILDFGCYCGIFLHVASQEGWDCYGIEPLVMPAIVARARFGLRVITDTLRNTTYPPEFFDVVTSFQVFEHLINPEREIQKIRQILKPNGLLVIEVPNIDTIGVKLLGSRHRHFVQDHVAFFCPRTLSCFLKRMGFGVRGIYYSDRFMSLGHFVYWIEKYNRILGACLRRTLRSTILSKRVCVNFGDIILAVAEKE